MTTASARVLQGAVDADQAVLEVAGRRHGGWTSLSITSSLEDVATGFAFQAAARWPDEPHPIRTRQGAAATVRIGAAKVATGFVDKVEIAADKASHTVSATGRSKTADLVDCDAEPRLYEGVRLEELAAALAAPYGVAVRAETDTGAKLTFRVQKGEKVFDAIRRAAKGRPVLVTDAPDGALVLRAVGSARATTAIVVGENVLALKTSFDASVRYSEYRCRGVRTGDDVDFGAALVSEACVADAGVDRFRMLFVQPETGADAERCRVRATWEAANRYGRSIKASYTVAGWRQGDGRLWTKGELVPVRDPLSNFDGELLIVSTTLALSEDGTTTALELAPLEAYELLPPLQPRGRRGRSGKAGLWAELAEGVKVGK